MDSGTEQRRRGSSASDAPVAGIGQQRRQHRISSPSPMVVESATATGQARMHNGHTFTTIGTISHTYHHAHPSHGSTTMLENRSLHTLTGTNISPEVKRHELIESLRFPQLDGRMQNLRQATPSTCAWIKTQKDYQNWHSSDALEENDGFFWIKGNPGTGKSIAMKYLFMSMRASKTPADKLVISFFFNARGNDFEKSMRGMYCALLYNLFNKESSLLGTLDDLDMSCYHNILETGWTLPLLQEVFANTVFLLCSQRKRTYCFVDALDECPIFEVRDMLEHLQGLVGSTKSQYFRVCFSSRHYPQICLKTRLTMALEKEPSHNVDIQSYISSRLECGDDVDPVSLNSLKAKILEKSSGIFLWVTLVVHQLNELGIQADRTDFVERHLENIPSADKENPAPGEAVGLYGLFENVIRKDRKGIDDFVRICQIIFRARRPLRPEELYVVLRESYDIFDHSKVSEATISKTVLSMSKGLAEVTGSNAPSVQFIHETVAEFISEGGIQKIFTERTDVDGHEILRDSCLQQIRSRMEDHLDHFKAYAAYIQNSKASPSSWRDMPASREPVNFLRSEMPLNEFLCQAMMKIPFIPYASLHVLWHANEAQALGICQNSFMESFPVARWVTAHNLTRNINVQRRYDLDGTSLLSILAREGYTNLIQSFLNSESTCLQSARREQFTSALYCAIHFHQIGAAYVLLGLDPAQAARSHLSHVQPPTEFRQVSRTLLDRLVSMGSLQLLRAAVAHGQWRSSAVTMWLVKSQEMLDLLVELALLPDLCADQHRIEKLDAQQLYEDLPFVRLAIDQNPRLLTEDVWGGKGCLDYAADRGFLSLAAIYLSHCGGGQDSIMDYLRRASIAGNLASVKHARLLGADVNAQDDHGRTAVHMAAEVCKTTGSARTLQVLLAFLEDESVDWSLCDTNGESARDLALNANHPGRVFALSLLKRGANPNLMLKYCGHAKTKEDHLMVPLIIGLGPWFGNDPTRFSKERAELICNRQCDLNHRDSRGRTALSWCFTLDKHKHKISKSPWPHYTRHRDDFGIQLLRSLRVDVNSRDESGCTILEHLIRGLPIEGNGVSDFLKSFFESKSLNPNLATSDGRHPLDLIIHLFKELKSGYTGWWHHIEALKLLLGTNKVDLEIQRRCASRAPDVLREIIMESMERNGLVQSE